MRTSSAALLAALCAAAPLRAQNINFTAFHTPAQVDFEIERFATRFPSLVRVVTLGNSLEGRPIKAIKISDNPATDEPAEADVVFVALHHAREWLSTETALFMAEQMLLRYATSAEVQADVNAAQIWIVPVVNPDGFAYTAAPGGNRYWRKNRRNNGGGTFGVDLNRNWGFQWGLLSGSSNIPSLDTYHGTGPFSEPELVVLRDFLNGRRARLESFVSYHTFSELWLRPWSYTTGDAPGEQSLSSLYERSRDAIAGIHGRVYASTISYTSSGEATDWVWQEHRVAAFTPELRPDAAAMDGFAPPPGQIIPTGQENVAAALALLHDAADTEVWIRDYAADTGAEPSAVWTPGGWTHAFWVSPDIWTVGPLTAGTTVPLHVRVNNASGGTMTNVRVEAYWTDPSISTEFPSPGATLIGTQTITVPAAGAEITMPWSVPSGTNAVGERHWCVGVVIKHARDMPLTTQAPRSSNVAFHNFWPVEALAGAAMTLSVTATNFLNVDSELRVVLGELPPGWRAQVPDPRELYPDTTYGGDDKRGRDPNRTGLQRKGRLLQASGTLLRPGERVIVPVRVTPPAGAPPGTTADVHIQGGLIPLVAGERPVHGNGFTYRVTVRAP